ncbi:hypothetical protein [Spiroplasma endosymbiont of Notiophilus biguttatus]|uniref:hypothetical protein n=1 Tax=Spiroplasma endosymbiont of Notiophilus biguttatus TaxID=3066285 RepID=UPI00313E12B7
MKTLLTTVSLLTFATSTGNLNSILNTEIKTTNILNNEPIKYDGEDKICNVWKENWKSPATF